MFNFSGGLLAGQHDCQKERPPPSRPIPVTFPSLEHPKPSLSSPPPAWNSGQSSGIPAHFLRLKKPSDVSLETLALLNVSFQAECDFETLLSSLSNNAQSYLPPQAWLETSDLTEPSTSERPVKLLSNGRRAPDRNEFYVRAKELLFENEDAFSNLTRKANGDRVPLRLAHFRKFWEALDNLAYYWDNSRDEYLPPKNENTNEGSVDDANPKPAQESFKTEQQSAVTEPATESDSISQPLSDAAQQQEPRKKVKTEASGNEAVNLPLKSIEPSSGPIPAPFMTSSRALPARTAPPKVPWAANMQPQSSKPLDLSKGSYKGYRIGNGAEMPDQYRLDCVRAFVEPVAWSFGITLVPHRRPPVLILENLRFPVRMNSVVWRSPQDRMKARQGWMEGPVLGVQCRPDNNFGSSGNLEAESALDIIRELGGMLLLAQERAREGKTEKRGGEGKWWTTKHRWGGGSGGEVGEATGASDTPSEENTPKVEEKPAGRSRLGSKDRRRPTPVEIWNTLKPGNPLWDPKVTYEAIGKDRNVAWDDVFMISSLNHHISVLKLRVHPAYIQYLTDGTLPENAPSDPLWSSPQLHRTRWFDLFNVPDRTEAMRGLWGIMGYLMRPQENPEVTMKDA